MYYVYGIAHKNLHNTLNFKLCNHLTFVPFKHVLCNELKSPQNIYPLLSSVFEVIFMGKIISYVIFINCTTLTVLQNANIIFICILCNAVFSLRIAIYFTIITMPYFGLL